MSARTRLILLLPLLALAACGNEGDATADAGDDTLDAASSRVEAAVDDEPADDAAPTGTATVQVEGAHASSFSGTATFAFGNGDLFLTLLSADETESVQVEGHGVVEGDRPTTGTVSLEPMSRTEPGYYATYVDAEGGFGALGARSGTLTLTSVSPERIEGELEFTIVNRHDGAESTVSGTFEAACNSLAGGRECF